MFRFLSSMFLGIMAMMSGISHQVGHSVSLNSHQATVSTQQEVLTQDQLLAIAGNPYANGNLPLGDKKYVTSNPQKGYVYLCNVQNINGGGAQNAGPWIHGTYWNINQKISVGGKVSWPQATFTSTLSGDTRIISGNNLPTTHTTGIFPIQSTDSAYAYDRNPNTIGAQALSIRLPANPTYSDTPYCMGGEVGIMTTGVALFNGFDAEYRDAAAYEVQDSCDGHPEKTGEYHYHSLSSCITNIDETQVIGFALDGFPITGPKVADNKYLTTANLDECHGITSQIMLDGKQVTMYHYVMTQDFPYSASCFRGKPVQQQLIPQNRNTQGNSNQTGQPQAISGMPPQQQGSGPMGNRPQPPQQAFSACSGKATGTSCSFSAPTGTVTGTCQTPPNQTTLACVPQMPR